MNNHFKYIIVGEGIVARNVWEKLDQAREMIRRDEQTSPQKLTEALA